MKTFSHVRTNILAEAITATEKGDHLEVIPPKYKPGKQRLGGTMITMHPGAYLSEVYLEPQGMSQSDLAKRLKVDKSSVSRLLSGKADLSASMAVRLSRVFDLSAEAWMEMQTKHSLRLARKELEDVEFERAEPAAAIQPQGYEFWTARPGNRHGGGRGAYWKTQTHRAERQQGKQETRNAE